MQNALVQSALLRRFAPYTVSGYAIFREITDNDGALPARTKALLLSAAATAKGQQELAERELRRAADLGVKLEEAIAAQIVLSSLRGEGAALSFETLLKRVYPDAHMDAGGFHRVPVAPGEAEANFKDYFGTVPAPLQLLMDLAPRAADAYYLMRKGSIDSNPLSPKEGELLLVVILAAEYSPMVARHLIGARKAGATDAEIAETILCAVPSGGVAAWMGAASHFADLGRQPA